MIYFLIYLFLEVLISVNIASAIGGISTFIEIIFSALIGVSILMRFRETLSENMRQVSMNRIDLQQFQKLNMFTLFGAVLLIVPGFFTDIIGLLMQFTVITSMFVNRYAPKSDHKNPPTQQQKDENVIDVEIISDTTTKH
ncbi:MAG: FxsA family protein [Campylobacterota bacterium]|nr:FxsA family protein [Campylobacterota bacterium]